MNISPSTWIKSVYALLLLIPLTLPVHADPLEDALQAINQIKDMRKAGKVVRKVTKGLQRWEKSIVYSTLGWKFNAEGEYKKAEKYFRKAYKTSDKHYEVIGIAIALFNQEKYKTSLKVINDMLKREDPEHVIPKEFKESANYVLGINHLQLKKRKKACSYWERSYAIRGKKSEEDSYGAKSLDLLRQHCG